MNRYFLPYSDKCQVQIFTMFRYVSDSLTILMYKSFNIVGISLSRLSVVSSRCEFVSNRCWSVYNCYNSLQNCCECLQSATIIWDSTISSWDTDTISIWQISNLYQISKKLFSCPFSQRNVDLGFARRLGCIKSICTLRNICILLLPVIFGY